MIKLEDLKVGDYVLHKYYSMFSMVEKINKKSFTTTQGITIFEKEFKHYFIITEEEARASIVHNYNKELKELSKNLKEVVQNINGYSYPNPYYTLDVEKIENDINYLLENIKEVFEHD